MSRIDTNYSRICSNTLSCCITFTVNGSRLHDEASVEVLQKELQLIENECDVKWVTWVIMPDQFHGLFETEQKNISSMLSRLKNRISWRLNLNIRVKKLFWLDERAEGEVGVNTDKFVNHILQEPVRAGLVSSSDSWPNQYTAPLLRSLRISPELYL